MVPLGQMTLFRARCEFAPAVEAGSMQQLSVSTPDRELLLQSADVADLREWAMVIQKVAILETRAKGTCPPLTLDNGNGAGAGAGNRLPDKTRYDYDDSGDDCGDSSGDASHNKAAKAAAADADASAAVAAIGADLVTPVARVTDAHDEEDE